MLEHEIPLSCYSEITKHLEAENANSKRIILKIRIQRRQKISQENFVKVREKNAVLTNTVGTAILHFKHLIELLRMTINTF